MNIQQVFETTLQLIHDRLLAKEANLYKIKIAQQYDYPEGIKFSQNYDNLQSFEANDRKKCF